MKAPIKAAFGKELWQMKHTLKISVSRDSPNDGIVRCRHVTIREKLLRILLGDSAG